MASQGGLLPTCSSGISTSARAFVRGSRTFTQVPYLLMSSCKLSSVASYGKFLTSRTVRLRGSLLSFAAWPEACAALSRAATFTPASASSSFVTASTCIMLRLCGKSSLVASMKRLAAGCCCDHPVCTM